MEKQITQMLTKRIDELNAADVELCKDRWERPEIHPLQKAMAREESNKVTFARQELQSILSKVQALSKAEYTHVSDIHVGNIPNNGWISVEDRLPELTKEVEYFLVIAPKSFPKNCEMLVAAYYNDANVFYSESGDNPMEDVTHWQPLPPKP